MNLLSVFTIIGSALGYLATVILITQHFPQFVRSIRLFFLVIYRWLIMMPIRFELWRWWRQYRPSWRIANYEELQIVKDNGKYSLELQMEIEYRNRSDKFEAAYNDRFLSLYLIHEGKGWTRRPYYLATETRNRQVLKPSQSERITYHFKNDMNVSPLIKETVTCMIRGDIYGDMENTPYPSIRGNLKREGKNRFSTQVIRVNTNEQEKKPTAN